jgi:hypothetical protein
MISISGLPQITASRNTTKPEVSAKDTVISYFTEKISIVRMSSYYGIKMTSII